MASYFLDTEHFYLSVNVQEELVFTIGKLYMKHDKVASIISIIGFTNTQIRKYKKSPGWRVGGVVVE